MVASTIPIGPACARPARGLAGRLIPPGDKSISHRALILGAMARGKTTATGLLEGDDVLRTASAMRALGAGVERTGPGAWVITGVGDRGFATPIAPLDFGNSGTGCRLTMGAVAGYDIEAAFDGDASLRSRPMERVLAPLRALGAGGWSRDDRLPVRIKGRSPLHAANWMALAPSAQVKSAFLLAALNADGPCEYIESRATRDHTERMLPVFGARVETDDDGARQLIRVDAPCELLGAEVAAPGDPSSAAFLLAAALVTPDSSVTLDRVLVNPTRSGFLETLIEMGADLSVDGDQIMGGEIVARLSARSGALQGVDVDPARAPSMIDEYPILAVAAAFAEGRTRVSGAAELRVKESDRIAAVAAMLRANGVEITETEDGFIVEGRGPGGVPGGGRVETHGDHRIAMSALILGLGARAPVEIDDAAMISTSYPRFFADMEILGADVAMVTA